MRRKEWLILLLAACLLLSACGGRTEETAMHLRKTEGEVWISDEKSRDVPAEKGLDLYSGYRIDTWDDGYAWIDLDETKQIKMDAGSQIEISREGKDLEVLVNAGSVFFQVTEPLEEDESLTFSTPELTAEVRGTCGWLETENGTLCLLEGKVRCETANGEKVTVAAGERALQNEDGSTEVLPLTARDIPEFVREEIEDDKDLAEWLEETGAPDIGEPAGSSEQPQQQPEEPEPLTVEPWQDAYAALLDSIRAQNTGTSFLNFTDFDAVSYQLYDIDKDGIPELMVEYGTSEVSRRDYIYTYRDGGVTELTGGEDGAFMSHSYFYTWPGGNGMLDYGGHMGAAWASRVQLVNGQLTWENILDEYFENPDEDSYTDIETIVPGTRSLDSFRIGINLPIYRYRQTGQDLESRSVQRVNADNAAVKAELLDVMENNGLVHAAVSDAYSECEGDMTFQEYLGPGMADKYSDYPLIVEKRAWVDVNGDGQVECVLHLVRDGRESYSGDTYAVMSLQDKEIYIYSISYFSGEVLADGVFANAAYDDPNTWISGERLMFDGEECYQYTAEIAPGVQRAAWENVSN